MAEYWKQVRTPDPIEHALSVYQQCKLEGKLYAFFDQQNIGDSGVADVVRYDETSADKYNPSSSTHRLLNGCQCPTKQSPVMMTRAELSPTRRSPPQSTS